ncbi:hypothetical protein [Candidatus Binatus sp.]|uniref:hypothetical protein n=1 Tax=Candidatus Binatus sp. TaxID=2811406 RepID=UPI002F94273B
MIELVLAADDIAAIRSELTGGETEACSILFAAQTSRKDGTIRLLVREVEFAAPDDYRRRGPAEAELSPEFVARVTKRARRETSVLVFVHSHLGNRAPRFSSIDGKGERLLADFLARRHPDCAHAALVISVGGMQARRLGTDEGIRVVSIGATREVLFDPAYEVPSISEQYDRQIRAFGRAGQESLQRLRVAIVGLLSFA